MSHNLYMTELSFLSLLRYGIFPKHNDAASLSSLLAEDWRGFMQKQDNSRFLDYVYMLLIN